MAAMFLYRYCTEFEYHIKNYSCHSLKFIALYVIVWNIVKDTSMIDIALVASVLACKNEIKCRDVSS